MSTTYAGLLHFVPVAMTFVFYLCALFVVLTRPADGTAAKKFACASVLISLLMLILTLVFRLVVPRFGGAGDMILYFGLTSIFSAVVNLGATGLMLMAVFTGRLPVVSSHPPTRPATGNENPYAVE